MFYHGYDNYMAHAFPHDELKPITRTWTDSLGELGNLNREHLSSTYEGVALTLIDATSTLAVVGNVSDFAAPSRGSRPTSTRVDVRVNAFECNIRVLGGLLPRTSSPSALALVGARARRRTRRMAPGGAVLRVRFDRERPCIVSVGGSARAMPTPAASSTKPWTSASVSFAMLTPRLVCRTRG